LLQHAHEIVKKILFHDLTLFVPARNGTEIHVETLVRGLDTVPPRIVIGPVIVPLKSATVHVHSP
jgi:hypothetical protein